jgi:hypothetical protein
LKKEEASPEMPGEGQHAPPNRCCAGIKFLNDAADDTNSIKISGLSGTGHSRPGWKEWREVKMYFFGLHFFARMALSPQNDS